MNRRLPLALLLIAASPDAARAADEGAAPERARELLAAIEGEKDGEKMLAHAEALLALEPAPIAALEAFLARERRSTDGERREVLGAIEAEVPDEEGRFGGLERRMSEEIATDSDEFDWLPRLAGLGRTLPGLGEVVADVAAIRALAGSRSPPAASAILAFAFTEVGLVYRDECGRQLRLMSPYSLPALIRGSQDRKHAFSLRRYANYQLERLDRESPHKAMRDAVTDDLKIEILSAFAESRHREAIYVVLDYVDKSAPRVREAARDAWLRYIKSRPYTVPKRKLELPGGKKTDEEEPLWLDHKELQEIAIRRKLAQVTGEKPRPRATLMEMSDELFSFYDRQRAIALAEELERALERTKEGEVSEAAAMMDRILAQAPDFERKPEMVPVYLAYGEELIEREAWAEAALAFGKAHGLAPEGPEARAALGQHHFARGKALEARGDDSSAAFERAREVDPSQGSGSGPAAGVWMLYAGIWGAAGGLFLLALTFLMRRRS